MITDATSRVYQLSYGSDGLISVFTRPDGTNSVFTYDASGLLTKDAHQAGAFIELWHTLVNNKMRYVTTRTATGRERSILISTLPMGYARQSSGFGAPFSYGHTLNGGSYNSSPSGFQSSNNPKPDARFGFQQPVLSEMFYTGNDYIQINRYRSTAFSYNDLLNIQTQQESVEAGGNVWQVNYSAVDQTTLVQSPLNRVMQIQQNNVNQITKAWPYTFAPVEYSYDLSGRLTKMKQLARETTLTYSSAGYVSQIQNSVGNSVQFTRDKNGRILTQTLPDARTFAFTYDLSGNLSTVQTAAAQLHGLFSNSYDSLSSYAPPAIGTANFTTTYGYDLEKRLSSISRPDGSTFSLAYGGPDGLLKQIETPDGTYSYGWAGVNIGSESTPGGVSYQYTYAGDRLMSETTYSPAYVNLSYVYSGLLIGTARLISGSNFISTIAFTYDADRLLTGVGDLHITRSPTNGLVTATDLDAVHETMTYDFTYGELSSYTASYGGAPVYKEEYERDALGRITTRTVTDGSAIKTQGYAYDLAGRLNETYSNGILDKSYGYDANSNRTSIFQGPSIIRATYDAQDRMLTYGPYSFTYNPIGEVAGRTDSVSGEAFTYTYDSMGGLKTVVREWSNSGSRVTDTYSYVNDARGRRIQMNKNGLTQKSYAYDEANRLIADFDSSGNLVNRFVYATMEHAPDFVIANNVNYKVIHDHVGSVKKVIRSSDGLVMSAREYNELGRTVSSLAPDFQPLAFGGGLVDEITGFTRFGARDYDPDTGRWLSKDPILMDGGNSNLYGYGLQDPVNMIDPSGLSSLVFRRKDKTLTLLDKNGIKVGAYPAENNTTLSSNGPWPNGIYQYSHYKSHPESGPSGPFGANGNFVFTVPSRLGMGVHSGRSGPVSNTEGCVRTTDSATGEIKNLNPTDPLTTITIED